MANATHSTMESLRAVESELPPLRYIDYIVAPEVMEPVLAEVSKLVGRTIVVCPPPSFVESGPKESQALSTFSEGCADLGRV